MDSVSTLESVSLSDWATATASLKDDPFEGRRVINRESSMGRPSKASCFPELLRGREKLNDGRGSELSMENSDIADGEQEIGKKSGLIGEWGSDVASSFEDFLTASKPLKLALSSSALSMTERMLAMLRAGLGGKGDLGGARPP